MDFPEDQITELRDFGNVATGQEGTTQYLIIEQLQLPEGCTPGKCDTLLCPVKANGYNSKLYFAERVRGIGADQRNWHGDATFRILERNWYSFSWQLSDGSSNLRLAQILALHLKPLRSE